MYAKSLATIANILESAQELFLQKNYADVTMSDIAGVAEVTKGALYHHFNSKEDLYLTMMHAYLQEIGEVMWQTAREGDATCRERLRHFTLSFLTLPAAKQELMRLVRRDINIFKNPQREKLVRAYQAALPEPAEAIIRNAIANGEIRPGDPRLLSWEYVAIVEVVLRPYARRVLGSPEEMADFVISLFFDGLAATEKRD